MSDGLTASSLCDGFARCSAKHAAALACAEGVVVAGRAVAVAGSDPASVVAAAPVAACPLVLLLSPFLLGLSLRLLLLIGLILFVSLLPLRKSRSSDSENQRQHS